MYSVPTIICVPQNLVVSLHCLVLGLYTQLNAGLAQKLYSMWPLDRTAPGPDALYSSRHFQAESELKLKNALWKDSTVFLHSFFCLVSFM